jgi:hypothetical protein
MNSHFNEGIEMDDDIARKIILNAVETTEPTWKQYGVLWKDIDYIFVQRGYEQGGFNTSEFSELLENEKIFSIEKIGQILNNFDYKQAYNRKFAGGLDKSFYQDLANGQAGIIGEKFYKIVKNFKGNKGMGYFMQLWRMLICCNYMKNNYNSSFIHFLRAKYTEYKGIDNISDNEFLNISAKEWDGFKKVKKPWNELYGIGESVFDFIMGDLVDEQLNDYEFVKNSYKLDDANIRFLKVTGIFNEPEHDKVIEFLNKLELPYTIRQINKGIYSYCSVTALEEVKKRIYEGNPKNHGFCHPDKCVKCKVNEICEKNFEN